MDINYFQKAEPRLETKTFGLDLTYSYYKFMCSLLFHLFVNTEDTES